MSLPVVELRQVDYHYPDGTQALRGVHLQVERGCNLALLGPNGAGKSSLLMHLNGILRPRRGEIFLEGDPVSYSRKFLKRWRAHVGLVFQNPDDQLFAPSVLEEISFGPLNLGLSRQDVQQRVASVMAQLGLQSLAHRPPHMLSLGQKKRVAIAGIVAMRPSVLMLDEPTAGLDREGVERLSETLSQLKKDGCTVVLSTHNVDFAYAWAERVALFCKGEIPRQGRADTLLTDADAMQSSGLSLPSVWQIMQALGVDQDSDRLQPRNHAQLLDRCRLIRSK
ncbi:MAG: ATP-binding cassette domain-containing protein [Magnetococcales bacterium]|nr:ATP-binding cassette domain-containing protein [Magnetococcales bacterium]